MRLKKLRLRLTLRLNDYGKEAKSIGDCGEDCSSCTHSIPDGVGNNQLHENLVKFKSSKFKSSKFKKFKVQEFKVQKVQSSRVQG